MRVRTVNLYCPFIWPKHIVPVNNIDSSFSSWDTWTLNLRVSKSNLEACQDVPECKVTDPTKTKTVTDWRKNFTKVIQVFYDKIKLYILSQIYTRRCNGMKINQIKNVNSGGDWTWDPRTQTSCVTLSCLPDWANLASVNRGIFNFTFVCTPIDFWT